MQSRIISSVPHTLRPEPGHSSPNATSGVKSMSMKLLEELLAASQRTTLIAPIKTGKLATLYYESLLTVMKSPDDSAILRT